MNEQVQQALCALIAEHGAAIAADAGRFESLLRERCPANKRELALLLGVLRSGVMSELVRPAAGTAAVGRLRILARRIEDEMGVKADPARWAVESWALALGWPLEVARPVSPAAPVTAVRAPAPDPVPAPAPVAAPPPAAPAPVPVPDTAPVPVPDAAPVRVPDAASLPAPAPAPLVAPASAPRRGHGAAIAAAVVVVAVVLYVLWRSLQR